MKAIGIGRSFLLGTALMVGCTERNEVLDDGCSR